MAKKKEVKNRIPVVVILGHVDHGKTTILDKIRGANVQGKEVGGMTQKVSSFTISVKDKKVTFIDTPGHEAFDLMRLRGGSIADIALLIVAADDSVKPQTEESIEIIKSSDVKPIVVINKVDLPNIDLVKVRREIGNKGLSIEGSGGKIPVVEVSGKSGKGLDDLLDMILLVSDVEGLRAAEKLPKGSLGKAFVLESVKDRGRGNVSSIIQTEGEVNRGDWLGYKNEDGYQVEKVKGIISEEGKQIDKLESGSGGMILGLSSLIKLGTVIHVLEENDEKLLATFYKEKKKKVKKKTVKAKVEDKSEAEEGEEEGIDMSFIFGEPEAKEDNSLKVIVKSSSEGSLEAIEKSLKKVKIEGFTVDIVHSGVGEVSSRDVELAEISKAIILGFEVSVDKGASDEAREKKVLIRNYDIIYKLIDEVSDAVTSLSEPAETEEEIGQAEVRQIFTLTDGSQVIGCRVKEGLIKKGCKSYIVRNDDIVGEGKIDSLRTQKETINEAKSGQEFGAILDKKVDVEVGDSLYCYKVIK